VELRQLMEVLKFSTLIIVSPVPSSNKERTGTEQDGAVQRLQSNRSEELELTLLPSA